MGKDTSHTNKKSDDSLLSSFRLYPEYNVSYAEEKKSVKERTN